MPQFTFMARDKKGLPQTGQLDAMDEEEVVAILQNRGWVVTSLVRKDGQAGAARAYQRIAVRKLHGRAKLDDLVLFCQQLATLLGAGVPLLKSLEVIANQVESRTLLAALEQMRQDIEAGRTFRDALAKHPRIFSSFWVNLAETGEASGHLAQSLSQLASYLQLSRALRQKTITALTYPCFLVVAAVGALVFFLLKIVPVFNDLFVSMHVQLPAFTRVVIAMSGFVLGYFVLIVAAAAAGGYFLRELVRTEQGRRITDELALTIPVLNGLFINLQLAQFARGLSALLESGVPILYSLEIVATSATNTVYGRAIREVKDHIREGRTMAEPLGRAGLFPPMMVQMVQVGEEIGELGKMLDRVAIYYEERVSIFIDRMMALFEPVAVAIMAVIIGSLVISMFLPIFSLANAIRG